MFKNKLIAQLFLITISLSIPLMQCEYFTATTDMKKLLIMEQQLIKQFDEYIEKQELNIFDIINIYNNFTIDSKNSISAKKMGKLFTNKFKIEKRLVIDWEHISVSISSDDLRENQLRKIHDFKNLQKFPTHEDVEGAASALARLTKTYRLNISDLANGKIRNVQYNNGLSASDLFEIGFLIINLKIKDVTVSGWINEALKRFNLSGTDDDLLQLDILHYLIDAYKKEENYLSAIEVIDEILKINPNYDMFAREKIRLTMKLQKLGGVNPFDVKKQEIDLIDKQIQKYDKPYEHSITHAHERNLYETLCRGNAQRSPKILAPLRCRYLTNKIAFLKIAPFKLEEISLDPYIVLYHDAIYDSEIEMIKNDTRSMLERASVESYDGEKPVVKFIEQRVSKAAWLHDEHDEYMMDITTRIADMTGLSMKNAEQLQIVNYGIGGYYDTHLDYAQSDDLVFEERGIGNRVATLMFYMSDVEEGGATVFPLIKTAVFPIKGSAVFWYNLYASGEGDPRTEHAGCPVLVGNKWVSNKWIHLYDQLHLHPCKLHPDHLSDNSKTSLE